MREFSVSSLSGTERSLFATVAEVAEARDQGVYAVGGYVRDQLLGRACTDIDIVTIGSGLELAQQVARALRVHKVTQYRRFGTASFAYKGLQVEFVGARRESYNADSRKPIVENASLEEDLARRDFTINALAVDLQRPEGGLIDQFGGINDLASRLVRTPLAPERTFSDDPLRMMRAIRFATQLDFRIEASTLAAITACAERLSIVSPERIIQEFNKILLAPVPSKGLLLLEKTGLLALFLPELAALKGIENIEGVGHKDNFYHTLKVVDNAARAGADLYLRWAALLHDVGKPRTKRFVKGHGWTFHSHEFVGSKMVPRIFSRLRMPLNAPMRRVKKLVALHMRPIVLSEEIVTDSAVRRLLFDAGDDIESLMQLCEADITSKNPRKVKRYMTNFSIVRSKLKDLEERDRIRNFQPPVSGELIMKIYGLPPCREVGILKNAIKEAILEGIIPNEGVPALHYLLTVGKEMGLKEQITLEEMETLLRQTTKDAKSSAPTTEKDPHMENA